MANMIPAVPADDTQSEAERSLFRVLREGLNDSYTVFHSFYTLSRSSDDKFIDGEIDFLIVSPNLDLLVLEVKGGTVTFDGPAGSWHQNGRPLKESPFKQAEKAKFKLRDFLKTRLGDISDMRFSHGVCFPDVFTALKHLPADADPEVCITGPDLVHMERAVVRVIESFGSTRAIVPGSNQGARLRQALMPHCEFGVSLVDRIGQEERKIFELTENQCRILDVLRNQKRALIAGCAGSGKTIMAVKKARELAADGKMVLLLAYNRLISEKLAGAVADLPRVTASNYHDFCTDALRRAGEMPAETGDADFYDRAVPQAFADLTKEKRPQFDAVIVDEGQDFRIEYWLSIDGMVGPDGFFYVFYDPDQNVFNQEMQLPNLGDPYVMTDNCRNTRRICLALKPLATMEMRPMDGAPEGCEVFEFSYPTPKARRRQLGKVLHELVNDQKLHARDIVVLGGHSIARTCVPGDRVVGNLLITEGDEEGPNVIHYYTYMKFKGCEAKAVIALDVDEGDGRWSRQALYTTMSRASHVLYVIRCTGTNKGASLDSLMIGDCMREGKHGTD